MEYLVLGPASMGIFSLIGCITKYEKELKNIKEISGSSAGAVIGVALALDIPLPEILDRLLSVDFENLTKFKIKCLVKNYGLIDMKPVREILVKCYGCDPTFSELQKKVYISSYCLNRCRTEYFSVDSHPDMKVVDAVCMSIAIPLLFPPVKHMDMFYMDGCTRELIPVTPFLDKKADKIFCIKLKLKEIFFEKITNLKQFIQAITTTALKLPDTNIMKLGTVKEIDTNDIDIYNFTMPYEHKLRLFIMGMNT
jgi:predicted acylesterase/phospholipase RssA